VTALVLQTAHSIGYVEYAYAVKNKPAYSLVQNKAGKFVSLGIASFQAATEGNDWS
jgi:phosphate transport system substrate-binding protein